jgi:arylsulfatase A-like enzyme
MRSRTFSQPSSNRCIALILSADQKRLYIRQIDIWAAYMAYSDNEIGRIIQTIDDLGQLDNTLIIFVCGDNGMSGERSMNGTPNEVAYFNGFAFTVEQMLPLIPPLGYRPDLQSLRGALGLRDGHALFGWWSVRSSPRTPRVRCTARSML